MSQKAKLNDMHLTGLVGHSESILDPEQTRARQLLVVDDDPGVQDLIHDVLSGAGP